MSPRLVCKLERFGECSKAIPKTRPWQEFCCDGHRTRYRYLTEKRRKANQRKRGQSNACCTHSTRIPLQAIHRTRFYSKRHRGGREAESGVFPGAFGGCTGTRREGGVLSKLLLSADGRLTFWCPGCECGHWFKTSAPEPTWTWNGSMENPTVQPSIRTQGKIMCHVYLTDGRIQFLGDCGHALAGKTVPMVDWDTLWEPGASG